MVTLKKLLPESFRAQHRASWASIRLPVRTIYGKLSRYIFPLPHPGIESGRVYLHLGSGAVNHPSFINVDALPAPHIHYLRPIDNLSLFRDASVDLIYACHCLEHFSHLQVSRVLSEWYRVLKNGGLLRLSVPDFDLLLEIYNETGGDIDSILGVLMGGQDYKYNFHMTAFNRRSLAALLTKTGFGQPQEWRPGSSELTTFQDFSDYKLQINGKSYPISLNLEAVK